jgi:hypothetical protein
MLLRRITPVFRGRPLTEPQGGVRSPSQLSHFTLLVVVWAVTGVTPAINLVGHIGASRGALRFVLPHLFEVSA